MKALEEVGKGLIALANLIFALVIFKEAMSESNISLFTSGIFFIIGTYYIGYKLIKKSNEEY